jgi:arylformamidase
MERPTEPASGPGPTPRGAPRPAPGSGRRRLVELSHPIHHGMVTYPGLPGPELSDHLPRAASPARYGPGTQFHIGRITMVANTGTYLDSPAHAYADATDIAGLPLGRVADLDGLVVRVNDGRRAIDRDAFAGFDVGGRAVLVHTGWDRHWGSDRYGVDSPFLTAAAAAWLVGQGAGLVGIDAVNVDDPGTQPRPVHQALLGAGIPILEHLCGLGQLPAGGFRLHAAPPQVVGIGTWPVRAYAVLAEG